MRATRALQLPGEAEFTMTCYQMKAKETKQPEIIGGQSQVIVIRRLEISCERSALPLSYIPTSIQRLPPGMISIKAAHAQNRQEPQVIRAGRVSLVHSKLGLLPRTGIMLMRGKSSDNGSSRLWRVSVAKSGPPFVAEEMCRGRQ